MWVFFSAFICQDPLSVDMSSWLFDEGEEDKWVCCSGAGGVWACMHVEIRQGSISYIGHACIAHEMPALYYHFIRSVSINATSSTYLDTWVMSKLISIKAPRQVQKFLCETKDWSGNYTHIHVEQYIAEHPVSCSPLGENTEIEGDHI